MVNPEDNYKNESQKWSRYSVLLSPKRSNGRIKQWVGLAKNDDQAMPEAWTELHTFLLSQSVIRRY